MTAIVMNQLLVYQDDGTNRISILQKKICIRCILINSKHPYQTLDRTLRDER